MNLLGDIEGAPLPWKGPPGNLAEVTNVSPGGSLDRSQSKVGEGVLPLTGRKPF